MFRQLSIIHWVLPCPNFGSLFFLLHDGADRDKFSHLNGSNWSIHVVTASLIVWRCVTCPFADRQQAGTTVGTADSRSILPAGQLTDNST